MSDCVPRVQRQMKRTSGQCLLAVAVAVIDYLLENFLSF